MHLYFLSVIRLLMQCPLEEYYIIFFYGATFWKNKKSNQEKFKSIEVPKCLSQLICLIRYPEQRSFFLTCFTNTGKHIHNFME